MDKIFVILGKTLAGKTAVLREIEEKMNASRVVTFTSRPKREEEETGVDYYFVSHDQALSFILNGYSLANRQYKPHPSVGGFLPWYYGVLKEDLREPGNKVMITDIEGYKDLKEYQDVVSIYLHITPSEQSKRLSKRGEDLKEETLRRIEDDDKVFDGFKEKADYVINVGQPLDKVAKEVLEIINAK